MEHRALAHLDAAYNLARWLMHHEEDARDVVQEAATRAIRHANTFRGNDEQSAAWMLTIVRRVAFDALRKRKDRSEESWTDESADLQSTSKNDPVIVLDRQQDIERVRSAIAQLPTMLREVIVLREIEEMPYKRIAEIIESPIGTVMSRLARGRQKLAEILTDESTTGGTT